MMRSPTRAAWGIRPRPDGSEEDGEARRAGPGVEAVGDEGGAVDLPADPHPVDGHRLVSGKPYDGGEGHRQRRPTEEGNQASSPTRTGELAPATMTRTMRRAPARSSARHYP